MSTTTTWALASRPRLDKDSIETKFSLLSQVLPIFCKIGKLLSKDVQSSSNDTAMNLWHSSYYFQDMLSELGVNMVQDLVDAMLICLDSLVRRDVATASNTPTSFPGLRALLQHTESLNATDAESMTKIIRLDSIDHQDLGHQLDQIAIELETRESRSLFEGDETPLARPKRPIPWVGDWAARALQKFSYCPHADCRNHEQLDGLVSLSSYRATDPAAQGLRIQLDFLFAANQGLWDEVHLHHWDQIDDAPSGKQVKFLLERPIMPEWHRETPERLQSICEILGEYLVGSEVGFNLVLDTQGVMWYHEPLSRQLEPSKLGTYVPLTRLISCKSDEWDTLTRYFVAVILGYALYHFYDGPLLGKRWPKHNIILFTADNQVRLLPYLQFDPCNACASSDQPEKFSAVWYPVLIGFAVTLLELQLGQSLEASLNIKETITSNTAEWQQALKALKRTSIEGDAYRNAIEMCLKATFGSKTKSDADVRDRFYEKVLLPMETELLAMSGFKTVEDIEEQITNATIFVEELDHCHASQSAGSKQIPEAGIGAPANAFMADVMRKKRRRSSLASKEDATLWTAPHSKKRKGRIYSLFNNGSRAEECSQSAAQQTDTWIDECKNAYHFRRLRRLPDNDSTRVKIAILDTGLYTDHFDIMSEGLRVKKICSWVDGKKGLEDKSTGDSAGHGTYVTSIILNLAPNADLYIAKITKTEQIDSSQAECIAEAIRTAYKEWKVDIINCSFGFDEVIPSIQDELKIAIHQHNCLVFAAASNDGDKGRSFPAIQRGVFCVNSTDGLGNRSSYNPEADKHDDNFSILGENIEAAWPDAEDRGATERLCGTSYAAPVAASLAARILDWAVQTSALGTAPIPVKSEEGMRKIFMLMAGNKSPGYCNIRPDQLFGKGRDPAKDIMEALAPVKQSSSY